MADVDISGLADKTKEEVKALWEHCRALGDKAHEYIVRDHYTQQFGGEPSDVTEDAPAAAPEPAPEPAEPETVQEPAEEAAE